MVRSSSLVSVFVLVGLSKYVVDILPPDTVLDSVHVAQQLPKSGEVIYYQMKPEVDNKHSTATMPHGAAPCILPTAKKRFHT